MEEENILFKVIIVGDTGVGKSCVLLQFTEGRFTDEHNVTIGVEFGAKTVQVDGEDVTLQIWDTAGQESFKAITRSFYRNASGILLMFDLTLHESFENCEMWLDEIRSNSSPDIVILLIGNQVDYVMENESEREVKREEACEFVKTHGLHAYIETSACTGLNIQEAFQQLAEQLYDNLRGEQPLDQPVVQPRRESIDLNKRAPPQKKKRRLC